MNNWKYTKGLHKISSSVYAYLSPHGQWGLSNAGLIVNGNQSMLVDTLIDLNLTREMLDVMKKAVPRAAEVIDTLIITHGDDDHFFGNELVKGAEIICTKGCAKDMSERSPQEFADILKKAPTMGELGDFFLHCFGEFDFESSNPLPATRTFEGSLSLSIGSLEVQLIEVGPAHSSGDMIVYIPSQKVVFAGDIMFYGSTPVFWAGPVDNLIKACDLILDLDVEIVVPGHGPITDKNGVESVKGYWKLIKEKTRKCYEAGLSEDEAVAEIDLGEYAAWRDSERIVVNVNRLYAEFSGDDSAPDDFELFSSMAALAMKRKAEHQ